jgi:hypothetical protein
VSICKLVIESSYLGQEEAGIMLGLVPPTVTDLTINHISLGFLSHIHQQLECLTLRGPPPLIAGPINGVSPGLQAICYRPVLEISRVGTRYEADEQAVEHETYLEAEAAVAQDMAQIRDGLAKGYFPKLRNLTIRRDEWGGADWIKPLGLSTGGRLAELLMEHKVTFQVVTTAEQNRMRLPDFILPR